MEVDANKNEFNLEEIPEKKKKDIIKDINYNRLYFNASPTKVLGEEEKEEDVRLLELGADYYSYALFSFFIFDDNEREIVKTQLKRVKGESLKGEPAEF